MNLELEGDLDRLANALLAVVEEIKECVDKRSRSGYKQLAMKRQTSGSTMKLLTLSDKTMTIVHSAQAAQRFQGTDLVIGCGDLTYEYMEYVISRLDVPLYFVRGNHSKSVEYGSSEPLTAPRGGIDLHRKTANYRGLLLAGVEGCVRYSPGPYQYSQLEMWLLVLSLVPALVTNRLIHGRSLDVFVTHAPPWGIHDEPDDTPHQGVRAFRWFLHVFKPAYHIHGHIHIYRPDTITETVFESTRVINTFGYREVIVDVPGGRFSPSKKGK